MYLPSERTLLLLCFFWFLRSWSSTDAAPFDQWGDGVEFRPVQGVQKEDLSDVVWWDRDQDQDQDQDQEQVQNVFKRFLFHYSRARPAAGAAQLQALSVHPLMRLSPKLSPRRKKLLLLRVRGLPEGPL